jgi:hypothetical protein
MTTTGTYNTASNLNVAQIIDEAFRRARVDPASLTVEHMQSARLSMDLMFIGWANDGVQQFIIDQQEQTLSGTATDISFTTPVGTIDVLDMVYRDANDNDIQIVPIGRQDYLYINNKTTSGQPICYYVDKSVIPPVIYLWGVQNITGTSIAYNRLRQIQDVGYGVNTPDVSVMYKEAVCACLAPKLFEKYGDFDKYPNFEANLIAKAEKAYNMAIDADRNRAPFIIKPRLGRRYPYGI